MRLFICLILSLTTLSVRADDAAPLTSVQAIDARIQEIESELIKAQGERFRAKNAMVYTNETVSPQYKAAKELEGELLGLRRQLDERLKVVDESIRTLDAKIAAQHKQVNELNQLAEAIRREMSLAESATNNPGSGISGLTGEVAQTEAQVLAVKESIKKDTAALEARKTEVVAEDKEAKQLTEAIEAKSADFKSRFGELHQTLDSTEAVKALDAKRLELARELQQLRNRKTALLKAAETP